MNETLLYTLPQWFIFAAIFVIVYGWIEDKKPFRIIGALILLFLGIFSVIIIMGDYFSASEYLTPEEILREELDDEIINEIPFEARLYPAYVSFVVVAILALPAAFFDLRNKKIYKWLYVITGLVALFGFFTIVGAINTL